jgi:putative spermidine/putrescine transport system substrate-binding protein
MSRSDPVEPTGSRASPSTSISRRAALIGGAGAALLASPPVIRRAWAAETLYVNTWGGPWEAAAAKNLFPAFSKATGAEIRTVSPISVAKLAAQIRTGAYEFDVTTLGAGDIVRANEAGLIEPITPEIAQRLGLWPDAVFQNGVASHAFSTIIAFRKDKYPNGGPQTWSEFWDTQTFAGPRCLQRYASRVLPIALAADGVPLDKLYPMDEERAFKSLDRIKPSIRVWWTQGPQSQQLLRDGEVSAIGMWHAQATTLADQGVPVEVVWNQAEIDRGYWVVAKGTPRAELAWQYIKAVTSPEPLAAFCKAANYGPLNPRAFDYFTPAEAARTPTSPEHRKIAFDQDTLHPGLDLEKVSRRFDQWLGA